MQIFCNFNFRDWIAFNFKNVTENLDEEDLIEISNHPNPFNPSTKISYSVPEKSFVKIEVYSAIGERIKTLINEYKSAGKYYSHFDGSDLASGVYILRMSVNENHYAKKILLQK